MVYKATFNLPDKNYYTGAVKGNGISLGWQGYNSYGQSVTAGSVSYQRAGSGNQDLFAAASAYGTTLGSGGGGATFKNDTSIGITTDSSKSGIIVEPDTQLKLCIKF